MPRSRDMRGRPWYAPETTFYPTIVEAARTLGYHVHHQRSTKHGTPIMGDAGFPDFVLVHPAVVGPLFVEVKTDRPGSTLSRAQRGWGEALLAAGARFVVVHCPSELAEFTSLLVDLSTYGDRRPWVDASSS